MASTYKIVVTVDPTGVIRGSRRVRKELTATQKAADRLRNHLSSTFAAVTVIAGITAAIRLLASFEQKMATVRGITGATTKQFKQLRDEAKRLGITTRFSASEAAEGMTFLARAGFSVNEVMSSTGDVLLLAQAGALGLGEAANITAGILGGFNLGVSETSRVVDVLASAANTAKTNVSELAQGLKFVAPVAAGLGVSLEETTAAMSALADSSLEASIGGTGLRGIMAKLEAPTSKMLKLFDQLGIKASDVKVSNVGLIKSIETLRDAGVGASEAFQLFEQRGGPAFQVLASNLPKIKAVNEQLEAAKGTARRLADVMDDNLNGSLLAVKSAIQGVIISLGDVGVIDVLSVGFRTIATILRGLSKTLEILAPLIQFIATTIAINLVAGGIVKLIAFLPILIILFDSLTIAIRLQTIAMLANPLTFIPVAIALAITALSQFEGFWTSVWDHVTSVFQVFVDFFTEAYYVILGAWELFKPTIETYVLGPAREIATYISVNFLAAWQTAKDFIVRLWDGMPDVIKSALLVPLQIVINVIQFLIEMIQRAIALMSALAGIGREAAGAANKANNPPTPPPPPNGPPGNEGSRSDRRQPNNFTSKNNFGGPNQIQPDRSIPGDAVFPDRVSEFSRDNLRSTYNPGPNMVDISDVGAPSGRNFTSITPEPAPYKGYIDTGGDILLQGGLIPFKDGKLVHFAKGGEITIGGNAGIDQNTLSINNKAIAKVSSGETIEVKPNGSSKDGGDKRGDNINITMNVTTPDADSFQRSQGQIQAKLQSAQDRASRRNN